jgi:hypothetical protein
VTPTPECCPFAKPNSPPFCHPATCPPGSAVREVGRSGPLRGACTRVRPDPITATFAGAVCHHTMATPAHLFKRLETQRDR